jgi:hypothetical protein
MTCHKTKNIFVILISKIPSKTYRDIYVSLIPFLVFGRFWRRSYKDTNGQDEKKLKENYKTKVTKIPKTKRGKYGMNKTVVYKNIYRLQNLHLDKFNLLSQFLSEIYICAYI